MKTRYSVTRTLAVILWLLCATLICLNVDASALRLSGAAVAVPKPSPPSTSQSSGQTSSPVDAKKVVEDTFDIVETIQKEKKDTTASGPPAKRDMMAEAEQIRAMFIKAQLEQAKQAEERAKNAKNSAEAEVYARDAKLKNEAAQTAAGNLAVAAPPQPASGTAPQPATGSNFKFRSSTLELLRGESEKLDNIIKQKSSDDASKRAITTFGTGQAGAGGVALYKAAKMLTPLERARITSAAVEDGRLVLTYDGQKLRFPEFDPQFLALAIRCVYGGEGLVKGTLIANEKNDVVISTGKERYGEVAWKKEFLPGLPNDLTIGQEIALDLGPGVGALSLPEPSYERITYYGPLRGNVLGQVLQESDMIFMMFWTGVDWRTGLPLDPAKLPGYESRTELLLKHPQPRPARAPEQKPAHWWDDTVWFVWTPDEFALQLRPQSSEFEFVTAKMKVTVWSAIDSNVDAQEKSEGEYLTQHYDDFARAFPVLARLKEAAKAVAAVRWLKNNQVPLDSGWATAYKLPKIDTLDKVLRYSVYIYRDDAGKPVVEQPQ